MIKNYRKGKVLIIEHFVPSSKRIVKSTGIVYKTSGAKLTLAHNFSGSVRQPIDITDIHLKNILNSQEVTPKEINSLSDFNTS
ncbi:MAG: hypothetical protein Q8O88_04850 [bacterium]|nr:hypothetical protein [bacterium]